MTPRLAALAAGLAVCGCGSDPAVDPALVDALAELHLADARAALDSSAAGRPAVADSLRRVALAAHGLDSTALAARLDALAASPDLARATYDSVDALLTRERQGPPAECPPPRGAPEEPPSRGPAPPPCPPLMPAFPSPETVQVFTTGGTIDKEYFDAKSTYEIGEPQIGVLLREAGVAFPVEVEALMRKDSLDLTDADRRLIADRVLATPHRRVIVTHGTDTMAATARVVADVLGPDGDKTVVFVGSLAPARFKATDAAFNVGFAAAAAQTLPPGAYVAMNGRVFDPHHVRKDRERNRFEPVTPGA